MSGLTRRKLSDLYFAIAAIWCILGFVLHIVMLRVLIRTGNWSAFLAVLAIWWIITVVVEWIRRFAAKKRKAKEEAQLREYREKYITELTMENERFGRVVLEHDANRHIVGAEEYVMEKPFGRHEELRLTAEVEGDDPAPIISALSYLYRNSRDILEMIYRYTLECCENYEEQNSEGKPYDIEYIRGNLTLYGVTITDGSDCIYASLDASISGDNGEELLGCHGITLDIELTKDSEPRRKRITCGLVG